MGKLALGLLGTYLHIRSKFIGNYRIFAPILFCVLGWIGSSQPENVKYANFVTIRNYEFLIVIGEATEVLCVKF